MTASGNFYILNDLRSYFGNNFVESGVFVYYLNLYRVAVSKDNLSYANHVLGMRVYVCYIEVHKCTAFNDNFGSLCFVGAAVAILISDI